MKKAILFCLALAPLALASCNNCNNGSCASGSKGGDKEELYAGILPAADAEGFVYTLRLDYDDDHNYTDGDFAMTQMALDYDTVSAPALKAGITSYTEGDFRIENKTVNGAGVKVLTLVPDPKESLGTVDNSTVYFLVNGDNTLTLVGPDFTKATNDSLNYTLTLK
ncbi:MAG: copper resistance protein NlpE [Bacteroides sp.]|nr:copper resistance protein NlpE [Bacteroides sp.]